MRAIVKAVLVVLCCSAGNAFADGVDSLAPETRSILRSEMRALDIGYKNLFTAYYSGNLKEMSRIAKEIEGSYILKKQLTTPQKHELHSVLPEGFLNLDQQFHYNAGMLSLAAEENKRELVDFYYSELSKGCISCHSQYAQKRFEHFAIKQNNKHHHH